MEQLGGLGVLRLSTQLQRGGSMNGTRMKRNWSRTDLFSALRFQLCWSVEKTSMLFEEWRCLIVERLNSEVR